MPQLHHYELTVAPSAIDANGHANNVEFVRWMQEAAISHADASGCTALTVAGGATWVARSHQIEYRRAAMLGDVVRVVTWVENIRRSFSLRKYRFERVDDGVVLAEGQTDWVHVDVATGRPKTVPGEIVGLFGVGEEG